MNFVERNKAFYEMRYVLHRLTEVGMSREQIYADASFQRTLLDFKEECTRENDHDYLLTEKDFNTYFVLSSDAMNVDFVAAYWSGNAKAFWSMEDAQNYAQEVPGIQKIGTVTYSGGQQMRDMLRELCYEEREVER